MQVFGHASHLIRSGRSDHTCLPNTSGVAERINAVAILVGLNGIDGRSFLASVSDGVSCL